MEPFSGQYGRMDGSHACLVQHPMASTMVSAVHVTVWSSEGTLRHDSWVSGQVEAHHTGDDECQGRHFLLGELFMEEGCSQHGSDGGSCTAPYRIGHRDVPLFQGDGEQGEGDPVEDVHADCGPRTLETVAELHARGAAHFEEHRGEQRGPLGSDWREVRRHGTGRKRSGSHVAPRDPSTSSLVRSTHLPRRATHRRRVGMRVFDVRIFVWWRRWTWTDPMAWMA